jgi:MoaA/NifB/PqqE/SkfB family radical SAM enzyme
VNKPDLGGAGGSGSDGIPAGGLRLIGQRARAMGRLLAPGTQMPAYILLFVTSRCNARCGHCFFWQDLNRDTDSELSTSEIDSLARSIGPTLQVTLTGGSPELRADLPSIARSFHEHCRPVNMTLCVTGWAPGRIQGHVEAILRTCPGQRLTVGISLDGIAEEHDRLRGLPGLFERVLETFEILGEVAGRNPQLRLACAICVSGLNHATAPATARWARKNLPIDLLKPILIRGRPRDHAAQEDGAATIAAYQTITREAQAALRHPGSSGSLAFSRLVNAKEIVQMEMVSEVQRTGRLRAPCSAARETAVIYPTGKVAGCELRSEVLGDLRDTKMDFSKIWFGRTAKDFRARVRREQCACYHHCFLSPPIFRSPVLLPKLAKAFWETGTRGGTSRSATDSSGE